MEISLTLPCRRARRLLTQRTGQAAGRGHLLLRGLQARQTESRICRRHTHSADERAAAADVPDAAGLLHG